jgi:hypothetical protein
MASLAQKISGTVAGWFRSRPLYELGQAQRTGARSLNDPQVKQTREIMGGGLYRSRMTSTAIYLDDLDAAVQAADLGQLTLACQLLQSCDQHPVAQGLMATRTSGLVRLPVKWAGNPAAISLLKQGVIAGAGSDTGETPNSLYDYLVPPGERSRFSEDAIKLGYAIGELQPSTSGLPLFRHLDPAGLQYRIDTNTWIYNSVAGPVVVEPGVWPTDRDSAFVLYTAGRTTPWRRGLWKALMQCYIVTLHALSYRSSWESKLANPARVGTSPVGADEDQDASLFDQIAAWGLNTTMLLKPGQDCKLVESNGRGYECFSKTIAEQTEQIIFLISGNTVVADGGSGFQNASLFRAIRNDLIQADANVLAHVENFQILPLILEALGFENTAVTREYVTAAPAELAASAQAFSQVASAITALSEAFVAAGSEQRLDVAAICNQFAIPVLGDADGDGIPEADETTGTGRAASGGGLRLLQGGASTAAPMDEPNADPGSETAAVAATGQPASDTALNGAQVTSLVEIVRAVAAGELPRDAAIGILKRAFLVSDDQAAELLGSAGNGFVPTTAAAPAPAAPPARTGPPVAEPGTVAA